MNLEALVIAVPNSHASLKRDLYRSPKLLRACVLLGEEEFNALQVDIASR